MIIKVKIPTSFFDCTTERVEAMFDLIFRLRLACGAVTNLKPIDEPNFHLQVPKFEDAKFADLVGDEAKLRTALLDVEYLPIYAVLFDITELEAEALMKYEAYLVTVFAAYLELLQEINITGVAGVSSIKLEVNGTEKTAKMLSDLSEYPTEIAKNIWLLLDSGIDVHAYIASILSVLLLSDGEQSLTHNGATWVHNEVLAESYLIALKQKKFSEVFPLWVFFCNYESNLHRYSNCIYQILEGMAK